MKNIESHKYGVSSKLYNVSMKGLTISSFRVESGIEGGGYSMRLLWRKHYQEEEWGFLLIDAQNAFNEENQMAMLRTVGHEWASGAQFTLNCHLI